VIIAVVALVSVFAIINALAVSVKEIEVPIKGLENELKVAQLSDIHIGTLFNSGYLKKLVDRTNSLEPDIVVITGDLVDGGGYVHAYKELAGLKAPVYFVTGNHEVYAGAGPEIFKDTNVRVLDNRAVVEKGLQIAGISDTGGTQHISLQKVAFDSKLPTLLLRHQPALMDEAASMGVGLQLSGHTHSGQIWPLNYMVAIQFRPYNGLHKEGDMYYYISPGTGTWGPPMRLGSRTEITLITLTEA